MAPFSVSKQAIRQRRQAVKDQFFNVLPIQLWTDQCHP